MSHDIQDRILFYLLGNLDPAEAAEIGEYLASNPEAAAHADSLRPTIEALVEAAPVAAPPAGLKAKLMAQVRNEHYERAEVGTWIETGVPGVQARILYEDDERHTILVRMAPGASYPTHRHAGTEECYVVSGDLLDGELAMQPGDYVAYPRGSEHGPLSTKDGCLILVTSSKHDEVIE